METLRRLVLQLSARALSRRWVGPPTRPNRLCFTLDRLYPEILHETIAATQIAAPSARVTTRNHLTDSGVVVNCYAGHWGEAFPQYGPGGKHNGPIVLADWQRAIVDPHQQQFIRGLIHSD